MGFRLSARDQPRSFLSIGPDQHDDSTLRPSQTDESLLVVVRSNILAREHRPVERLQAVRKVDTMLAEIPDALAGVVAHAIFIVYTKS